MLKFQCFLCRNWITDLATVPVWMDDADWSNTIKQHKPTCRWLPNVAKLRTEVQNELASSPGFY